ncbi:MAG: outer membrane lipoprotein chaperone LolA [Rhizobacter sp.]|jgi:outer membrane lipoprotein carrier protein|nr:outer membrane lipoprotein chaperone LolA [Rhizobacter sp.]MBP6268680.1 outer membrane lipoprotein chaperone LolA [Rhizobacter sp.]HOX66758.1 outer membrane lipoprotein chaperone LolA [Burkholderiaceae bacterium]
MKRDCVVRAAAWLACALFTAAPLAARADAVEALKSFVQDVKTGRATFTQTVTSPDGGKTKTSSGSFEFARPDRFRFAYTKPFEQLIVADGQKVWIHDVDLNQVSSRKFSQALGATPAALLAGGDLARDFDLLPLPAKDGLEWAKATPKARDGAFESMSIGFRGKQLAAVEIVDNFAQRSRLTFSQFTANAEIAPQAFKFTVPKGADVLEQ